ncbi:MAG: hypothetical protein TUN42_09240 [Dehalogenimonas sp.]
MKESIGDPTFPIWLIGDSPPDRTADRLESPLDPRHPARHNIWTPVVDTLQDRLFREKKLRLDTSRLYIRNAFSQPAANVAPLSKEILKDLIVKYHPTLVITFGTDAFKMVGLACDDPDRMPFSVIKNETEILGEQFRRRIKKFRENDVNILPLLHISIALNFLDSPHYFIGVSGTEFPNYFDYVGNAIADLLMKKLLNKRIWID